MLNTPSQELSQAAPMDGFFEEETPEVETETVAGEEVEEATEAEEPAEIDENEVFLIGDREITLSELKRLEDRAKNLEAGYTKKVQQVAEEHRAKLAEAETVASDLKAKADAIERFLEEDEKAIDWDMLSPSELKAVEKKFQTRRNELEKARINADKAAERVKAEKLVKANQDVFARFTGWKDEKSGEKVRTEDLQEAYKYAASLGMTQKDMEQLTESWQFIALIEAAKFNKIKTSNPEARKKVLPAKKAQTKAAQSTSTRLEDVWFPD